MKTFSDLQKKHLSEAVYDVSWGVGVETQVTATDHNDAIRKAKAIILKRSPKLSDPKYSDTWKKSPSVHKISEETSVTREEVELDEASKEHLERLKSMLDKAKPGSADHSQIRHAISAQYGDKHIPAKHRNVKPDMYEAVEVSHDRYMRSHGKKASGGEGNWMFTHKRMGDANVNDPKEVHSARGKFSDAKKSAQQWAKKHGHSTVYVMEEVNLDEVSQKTLRSYMDKAGEQRLSKSREAAGHFREAWMHPDHEKELNDPRTSAARKASLKSMYAKDDSKLDSDDHEAWRDKQSLAKLMNRRRKVPEKHSSVKEEVEQIDELKKSTLGSYIKKASARAVSDKTTADRLNRRAFDTDAFNRGDSEKYFDASDRMQKKYKNRLAGIAKATDRLTKEEVEQIDEYNTKSSKAIVMKDDKPVAIYPDLKSAQKDYYGKDGHAVGMRSHSAAERIRKANPGIKIVESVEQIDEISADLAHDVYKKRMDQAKAHVRQDNYSAARKAEKKAGETSLRMVKKILRREGTELDEEVKVGDKVHLGFGAKGGAGFKGTIMKIDGNVVHVKHPSGKEYKGPMKFVTKESVELKENPWEEIPMMKNQLKYIVYAAEEIMEYLDLGADPEEWYQNKLAQVHMQMQSLHAYMEGEEEDEDDDEMDYDDMDEMRDPAHPYLHGGKHSKNLSTMGWPTKDVNVKQGVGKHKIKVHQYTESVEPVEEKLSVKNGVGAWIDDFQKSDAPQFKGKSQKDRRNMALAAYLSAKGKNESKGE